ncbi:MAG: hypothetical protein WCF85_00440 [Rhodospirillaceae bacterium]
MNEPDPNSHSRFFNLSPGGLGAIGRKHLVTVSQGLRTVFGFNKRLSHPRENCRPLEGRDLKQILVDLISQRALINEAYEADRDNWQPMSFVQWQQMYQKSYCNFTYNDERLNLTMFMRHWEAVVGQSLMFDHENFLNELNTIVNEYGWFVESFTMPDQSVTVFFRRFNSDKMVREPPASLYYFAASWNKADIMKKGLLPATSVEPGVGRRVAEYDVLFKTFNLEHIRLIAKNMFDSSVSYSDSDDVSTNILRLIGFMPIIVFKVNTSKIAENVWSKREPIFDEDRENGILLSYTYLPAPAFETVMHEDSIPDIVGHM